MKPAALRVTQNKRQKTQLVDIMNPLDKNEPAARKTKTYNTRDSLVVTDPTTDRALTSLTRGERTGSRAFSWIWSYVWFHSVKRDDIWSKLKSTFFPCPSLSRVNIQLLRVMNSPESTRQVITRYFSLQKEITGSAAACTSTHNQLNT